MNNPLSSYSFLAFSFYLCLLLHEDSHYINLGHVVHMEYDFICKNYTKVFMVSTKKM